MQPKTFINGHLKISSAALNNDKGTWGIMKKCRPMFRLVNAAANHY